MRRASTHLKEVEINIIQTLLIAAGLSASVDYVPVAYVSNYDGDTLILSRTVQVKALSADAETEMREKIKVRIENIDTAEVDANCPAELDLAVKAKAEVRKILTAPQASIVLVTARKRDAYGRLLARVEVNGSDIGETLIGLGLARRWDGKRHPWC